MRIKDNENIGQKSTLIAEKSDCLFFFCLVFGKQMCLFESIQKTVSQEQITMYLFKNNKEVFMKSTKSVNSSVSSAIAGEWETPDELFQELDRVYHFTLDACARPENAKCQKFFTKKECCRYRLMLPGFRNTSISSLAFGYISCRNELSSPTVCCRPMQSMVRTEQRTLLVVCGRPWLLCSPARNASSAVSQ